MCSEGIGGYFELERSAGDEPIDGIGYQSARAALGALVFADGSERVWIPEFLCETIERELLRIGVDVKKYPLDEQLAPTTDLAVDAGELVLLVNFFGVRGPQVSEALRRLPRARCIIDHAHALFEPAGECLGTIYSPRKFFGVPDGGYLVTENSVAPPAEHDTESQSRCQHLLLRPDHVPEEGLEAYRRAEQSLDGKPHQRMSRLTRHLLCGIDYGEAKQRRLANFWAMHALFGEANQLNLQLEGISSPLTYPLWIGENGPAIRASLIANRVFSPTFWPELLSVENDSAQAARWAREIVHIPIDHRYRPAQIIECLRRIEDMRVRMDT